jgi:hypothetical protein
VNLALAQPLSFLPLTTVRRLMPHNSRRKFLASQPAPVISSALDPLVGTWCPNMGSKLWVLNEMDSLGNEDG